ncbi:MAG: hypothetical protein EYC70_01280 [Planctomycetota bacterium]|nr:MAG: hypothetical protein EYC70_01280 [Planctomycetota bacterium]
MDDIRTRLKTAQRDGTLDLAQLAPGITALELLGEELGLVVSEARFGRDATGTGVQLAGKLSIDGAAAEVRATFRPAGKAGKEIACDVWVGLSSAEPWQIDKLPLELEVDGFQLASAPDYLAVTLWARITNLKGVSIPVVLEVPGPGGVWVARGGGSTDPITLPQLAELVGAGDLRSLLPWEFDEIGLTEFRFEYAPGEGVRSISFGVATTTTKQYNMLDGLVLDSIMLQATVLAPFDGSQRGIDLQITGMTSIGDTRLRVEAARNWAPGAGGSWTFRGILTDLKLDLAGLLGRLAAQCGFQAPVLPRALPALTFDQIAVEITPSAGAFRFHASAHGSFDLADRGAAVSLDQVEFDFSRRIVDEKAEYPFTITASLSSAGTEVVPGLELRKLRVHFAHDAGWTASGRLMLDLMGIEGLVLDAAYTEDGQSSRLDFAAQNVGRVVLNREIDAALAIPSLNVSIERKQGTDERVFTMSADARLSAGEEVDIAGQLELSCSSGGSAALVFRAAGALPRLRIPVPSGLLPKGSDPALSILEAALAIQRDQAGWRLQDSIQVEFSGFPEFLPVPRGQITATLTLDATGFEVKAGPVAKLPPIDLGRMPNRGVALGKLIVSLAEIAVAVRTKGDLTLSLTPAVRLPAELNEAIFGKRAILATGKDLGCELTVGWINSELGATFHLRDSPLQAFPFDPKGESLSLDLGTAGLITIGVPLFTFGSKGFSASDVFSEGKDRPLQLPLTIVKHLLAKHVPEIAQAIPDAIPLLKRPDLLKADKLDVKKLEEFLRETFHDRLPEGAASAAFFDALQRLADAVTGLPRRLREYLFGDLPSGFHFSITADPTGSVTADIRTQATSQLTSEQELEPSQGGRPIMVLFPALPALIGLRLSNLQLGPIFGGSLILLRVNAEIDVFDPAMLVASILAAEIPALKEWMPDGTDAHATYQLHDLVMFIVYEAAGIPIPVPIFYEKLGIDVVRPDGLALAASVSFNPLTHNGLAEVAKTLSGLYKFVTTDAALDPKQGIQLDASIGPTYVKLPKFLGAGELGSEDKPLLDVNFSAIFANFLNGLKFFRLSDLLAGIPLEKRCGAANPKFGPLEFQGAWAATTREEFTKGLTWSRPGATGSNALVGLAPQERAEVLTVLDAAPKTGAGEGVVLLLAGEARLTSLLTIGGRFGMVTAGRSGFATGVQVYGDLLAGTLEFRVSGCAHIDLSKPLGEGTAGFEGTAILVVNKQSSAEGSVTVSDQEIGFQVAVDLFPQCKEIGIAGQLKGSLSVQGFRATVNGTLHLFGTSMTGDLMITEDSFALNAKLRVAGEIVFDLSATGTTLDPKNRASIQLSGSAANLSPHVMVQAAEEVRQEIHHQIQEWIAWADAGYREDARKWWWDRTHTLVNWEAQYEAFTLLARLTDPASASVAMSAVASAIDLLPAPIAQGVRALVSKVELFEGVDIKVATSFSTAQKGQVTLNVSGKYAGATFGPLPVTAALHVSRNPVADIARGLAAAILE